MGVVNVGDEVQYLRLRKRRQVHVANQFIGKSVILQQNAVPGETRRGFNWGAKKEARNIQHSGPLRVAGACYVLYTRLRNVLARHCVTTTRAYADAWLELR